LLAASALLIACAGAPRVDEAPEPGFQRGVALGFIDAEPGDDPLDDPLDRSLREVRALGASDVSILVPLYTESIEGRSVRRGALDDAAGGDGGPAAEGADLHGPAAVAVVQDQASRRGDAALLRVIRAARQRGLGVMVFPIVRLRVRNPGEWRGKLRPLDPAAWFADYTRELEAIARVCAAGGAARLAIGSELVSFEHDVEGWRRLAQRVRALYRGRLIYSANWDRFPAIRFWDAVDEIGVSAYFTLAPRGQSPTVRALELAWLPIIDQLAATAAATRRPVVFTEVGYPTVEGAAFWPWNDHLGKTTCAAGEGCEGALDPETQRRLWTGFVNVFADRARTSFLSGAYAWLWAGQGGLRDRGYTPRGKPAEGVLRLWYAADRPLPAPR